jgi:hypothetical protein
MQPPDASQTPAVARDPELVIEALTALWRLAWDVIQARESEIADLRAQLRLTREAVMALDQALLTNPAPLRALVRH